MLYTCTYLVRTYVRTYVHVYVHVPFGTYVVLSAHVCPFPIRTLWHTRTYTCTRTYVRTYTCTYTCTMVPWYHGPMVRTTQTGSIRVLQYVRMYVVRTYTYDVTMVHTYCQYTYTTYTCTYVLCQGTQYVHVYHGIVVLQYHGTYTCTSTYMWTTSTWYTCVRTIVHIRVRTCWLYTCVV